jgi:hypothetical protein
MSQETVMESYKAASADYIAVLEKSASRLLKKSVRSGARAMKDSKRLLRRMERILIGLCPNHSCAMACSK